MSQPPGGPASKGRSDALDLARRAARPGLRDVLAMQTVRTLLKLGFAGALAILAGSMIELGTVPPVALAATVATLLLSSVAGLLADSRQATAEAEVAAGILGDVRGNLDALSVRDIQSRPAGAMIAGVQRHPEALAALVVGHRAAATMLGLGPALAAVAVFAISWQAALVLLVASPIMVVFFVFVGGTIHGRATAQEMAFGQLAAQFEDRVRTLPTILASHGLDRERGKLEERMSAYASSTMGVLKVAFLNASIIDFFSSLSIALLAVFLGLGHLKLVHIPGFSDLLLWQSLFILMLAPEFFAPFRRYAEQYHAKAEGDAAAVALDRLIGPGAPGPEPVLAGLEPLRRADFRLPKKGLVAVVGASGAGKSTLLRRLAGIEPSDVPVSEHARGGVAWIGTDVPVLSGTLADAISWNRAPACPTRIQLAADRVGLLADGLLPGGLEARIASGGENLSGGQRLRIGIARALLSKRPVFADEPTAKLDTENAARVRQALLDCARDQLVVVATHDRNLADRADMVLDLDEPRIAAMEAASWAVIP
ncbi:ATP-binding cassette domain-containing protein [Mesorhizobium sp. ZMM04-5]|uniref:ATP-binding cassette domain-containing protein n=2 Tax=Mesorhizobium marinum TaxID=3228790 RepID=A0ABV3QUI6_9HYPH